MINANSLLSMFQIIEEGFFRPIGYEGAGILRTLGRVGAAIPWDGKEDVFLKFHAVELKTIEYGIPNKNERKYLSLILLKDRFLSGFSVLAMNFLHPSNRDKLIDSPYEWWDEWCGMLGNSVRKELPQAVFGELHAYRKILEVDKNAQWSSLEMGVQDICTSNGIIEVKSTLKRYGRVVEISSENQMSPNELPLYLLFIRLSKDPSSHHCIDSLVERIVANNGVLADAIEEYLLHYGLEKGSPNRKVGFNVLECVISRVDKDFPSLHSGIIVGGQLPDGISRVRYDLNLDVVKNIPFDKFLSGGLRFIPEESL